jgi:hypothetical protein
MANIVKNIDIRTQKQDKPHALKIKCFMAFKKKCLMKKEQKRQIVRADMHSRIYKMRKGFMKLVKNMKMKNHFSIIK